MTGAYASFLLEKVCTNSYFTIDFVQTMRYIYIREQEIEIPER